MSYKVSLKTLFTVLIFQVLLVNPIDLWSQDQNLGVDSVALSYQDSLQIEIDNSSDIESKSINLARLAESMKYKDPEMALSYARQGLSIARDGDFVQGLAENYALLGDIYISLNSLDSALIHYRNALDQFESLDKNFDYAQISMIIGNIYLAQNRYVEAQEAYLRSLDVAETAEFGSLEAHISNNLGVLYMDIEDYDDAKRYFESARNEFEILDDDFNANLSSANIYRILDIEGDYENAISGYLEVISYFLKNKNWESVAHGYNAIALIHYHNQSYTDAEEFIRLALTTVEGNLSSFEGPSSYYRAEIYTAAAKIFGTRENKSLSIQFAKQGYQLAIENSFTKNAFECSQILYEYYRDSNLPDSALFYSEAYIQNYTVYEGDRDVKQITQLKMQRQFDKMEKERAIANLKKEAAADRREILYIGALIISILILSLLFFGYKNQKIKADRANILVEKSELEREKLNSELQYKNKELATNMMYLLEKNEFITSITEKLVEMRSRAKKSNIDFVQEIIMELKRNSSKKIWEEFELRFKDVHADFYNHLLEDYPDLTPNEVRLCAFLRLNMSTKEISAITYQSIKSINMARFRLRKKLGIDQDENLISYLSQL